MIKKLAKLLNNNKKDKKLFISCNKLNDTLTFFDHKISYCANGNPAKKMAYPIILNNFDGNLDIENLIRRIREDRFNLHNDKIIESCKGCPNLYEEKWEIDYSKYPKLGYINFADCGLCNSKCIYCKSWTNTKFENGKYKPIIEEKFYNIIPIAEKFKEKGMITKDTIIDFTGGEPTIYEFFEESLNYFLKFGTKKILIFSNAILFSEIILKGIKKGIITITVSVDAGSQNTHKIVKGVESYNNVYENLKKYAKAQKHKNQVISKYIIIPEINDSFEEINLWIKKSIEIGINKLIINVDDRLFENEITKETYEKINKLGKYFENKMKENQLEYEVYSNMQYVYKYIKNSIAQKKI